MKQNVRKRAAVILSAVMLATTVFSAGAAPLTGWAQDTAGETVRVNPLRSTPASPGISRET